MVKRVVRDIDGNEVTTGDYFKIVSCCARDAIPSYFEGRLGKVNRINTDKKIEFEFMCEPLRDRVFSTDSFKKHCQKYKPN